MTIRTPTRYGRLTRLRVAPFALALVLTIIDATLVSGPSPAVAQDRGWVTSWMASPQPVWNEDFPFSTKVPSALRDKTIRQVVRVSLGGSKIRVAFSNTYGERPLKIGAASVALADTGSQVRPGTLRTLTFGGDPWVVVPPGAPVVSDPVDLEIGELASLAISMFLPDETQLATFHWDGRQTAFIADGNRTGAVRLDEVATTDARIILSDVLVHTAHNGAVVALGDSITDGNGATVDANRRWPDLLAERLASRDVAVLNAGISGARLLGDKMGVNAPARFVQDVLAKPGAKAVILLIGINDIAWPGTPLKPRPQLPEVGALKSGFYQLAALAKSHNLRVIGATMPPFRGALEGTALESYYSNEKEALRRDLNRWIRTSQAFDAVIDFDAILGDPEDPNRLAPRLDSGDHLHPGDVGNRVMADAIDLDMLLGR